MRAMIEINEMREVKIMMREWQRFFQLSILILAHSQLILVLEYNNL